LKQTEEMNKYINSHFSVGATSSTFCGSTSLTNGRVEEMWRMVVGLYSQGRLRFWWKRKDNGKIARHS